VSRTSRRASNKQDQVPSFAFYVRDWREDPALQLCPLAARGLWIEMLCIMWTSPRRGYLLKANGSKLDADDLATLTRSTEAEVKQTLSKLEAEGVFSTNGDGVIYSRRMVRDDKQRRSKAEAGRKGGRSSRRSKCEANAKQTRSTTGSKTQARARAGARMPLPLPLPLPLHVHVPPLRDPPQEIPTDDHTDDPDIAPLVADIERLAMDTGSDVTELGQVFHDAPQMGWQPQWVVHALEGLWRKGKRGIGRSYLVKVLEGYRAQGGPPANGVPATPAMGRPDVGIA
jgi:hypothetical protein